MLTSRFVTLSLENCVTDEKCDYIYPEGHRKARERCGRWPTYGFTSCTEHGAGEPFAGKPPHWQYFQTGKTSKNLVINLAGKMMARRKARHEDDLPETLAGRYIQAVTDPEILDITDDIALTDLRISQLLSRVTGGDRSPDHWAKMTGVFAKFDRARRMLDAIEAEVQLKELRTLILDDDKDRSAWDEIRQLQDHRRRLVEAEQKRREAMGAMLTAEEAMEQAAKLLTALNEGLEEVVDDSLLRKQIYLAVAHRFGRITGSGDGRIAERISDRGRILA